MSSHHRLLFLMITLVIAASVILAGCAGKKGINQLGGLRVVLQADKSMLPENPTEKAADGRGCQGYSE
jgi:hypothetical protein